MNVHLSGKSAIVTGATGDIGLALSIYAASLQASAATGAALRVKGGIVESIA